VGSFKPEYAGKMNFYLPVDDMLRHLCDKPSIGLILCKAKNGIVAELRARSREAARHLRIPASGNAAGATQRHAPDY